MSYPQTLKYQMVNRTLVCYNKYSVNKSGVCFLSQQHKLTCDPRCPNINLKEKENNDDIVQRLQLLFVSRSYQRMSCTAPRYQSAVWTAETLAVMYLWAPMSSTLYTSSCIYLQRRRQRLPFRNFFQVLVFVGIIVFVFNFLQDV